jgi:hypothetical protein
MNVELEIVDVRFPFFGSMFRSTIEVRFKVHLDEDLAPGVYVAVGIATVGDEFSRSAIDQLGDVARGHTTYPRLKKINPPGYIKDGLIRGLRPGQTWSAMIDISDFSRKQDISLLSTAYVFQEAEDAA